MKKRILSSLTMLVLICAAACAQAPNNTGTYYKNADGKKGQALKTAMFNIIKITQSGWSYDGLKTAYKTTDTRPDGYLRDWYSNTTNYVPGSNCAGSFEKEGDGYNREHLVPQSWFSRRDPMRCDIFHVVPTDAKINGLRADLPLGEVGTVIEASKNNYSKKGYAKSGLGYTGIVFEPNDEVKGDIARAYFYMVTCYEDSIPRWNDAGNSNATASYVFDGSTYPGLTTWVTNMMLEWSAKDPVDAIETARNNVIYGKQRNRNPFIDYPGLEQYIWGSKQTKAFSYNNYEGGGGTTDKEDVTMTFSATSVTATLGQAFTAPTLSTTPAGLAVVYSSSDTNVATVDSSTGNVTLHAAGTTTITATFNGNANYNANTASYQLTVVKQGDDPTPITGDGIFQLVTSTSDLESGKRYLIVSGTVSLTKLDGTAGTGSVTINSSQIDMNNADNTGLILTLEKVGDYWTVKGNDVYMALTADKNALNTSTTATAQTAKWTIMVDSESASITNSNYTSRSLKYNSGSNMFRCYTTGQQDVQLYKELEKEMPVVLRGDVNGDGQVTIADVTSLVNIILGSQGGDTSVADLNGDSQITIADVTSLVNIILGKGN